MLLRKCVQSNANRACTTDAHSTKSAVEIAPKLNQACTAGDQNTKSAVEITSKTNTGVALGTRKPKVVLIDLNELKRRKQAIEAGKQSQSSNENSQAQGGGGKVVRCADTDDSKEAGAQWVEKNLHKNKRLKIP